MSTSLFANALLNKLARFFSRDALKCTSWRRSAFAGTSFQGIEPLESRVLLSMPPLLSGLHLVDPAADRLDGQFIHLDFNGAREVDIDLGGY